MTPDIEYDALQSLASGARTYDFADDLTLQQRFAARRVWLFARTWRHILENGVHRAGLKASTGLVVTETATKENGGIVFVANPSETEAVSGYVPPFLPDVTLAPREIFAYVHDAPIGDAVPGGKFLASYVGLVKSDAKVLAAHIRPAPFEGARLYVYGKPGDTREVVLFHGAERGQGVTVSFSDAPQVFTDAAPSQIVALPTHLAGRTFFAEGDNAPVLVGADEVDDHGDEYATVELAAGQAHLLFAIAPSGAMTEISVVAGEPGCVAPDFDDATWQSVELPAGGAASGWYRAVLDSPDTGSGSLFFDAGSRDLALYVNGVRATGNDIAVVAGRTVFAVRAGVGGIGEAATLTVSGGCYLVNISRWRFSATESGGARVRIAL